MSGAKFLPVIYQEIQLYIKNFAPPCSAHFCTPEKTFRSTDIEIPYEISDRSDVAIGDFGKRKRISRQSGNTLTQCAICSSDVVCPSCSFSGRTMTAFGNDLSGCAADRKPNPLLVLLFADETPHFVCSDGDLLIFSFRNSEDSPYSDEFFAMNVCCRLSHLRAA